MKRQEGSRFPEGDIILFARIMAYAEARACPEICIQVGEEFGIFLGSFPRAISLRWHEKTYSERINPEGSFEEWIGTGEAEKALRKFLGESKERCEALKEEKGM